MNFIGCFLLLGFVIIALVLSLLGRTINLLGATVIWLWESFLDLFRPTKKEETQLHEDNSRPKMYDKDDGEYIDFTEIK